MSAGVRIRAAWSESAVLRIGLSALLMLAVAAVAAVVLAPSGTGIDSAPADAADFFSPEQIDRAEAYRAPGIWMLFAGLAIQVCIGLLLVAGRPSPVRRLYARLSARPLLGAAAVGVLAWVAVSLATLPLALIAHERSVDYGISTQDLGPWLADRFRATAISALFAAGAAFLLVLLARRLPRRWWLAGAALIATAGSVIAILAPVLIAPSFNDFTPLPQGDPTRARVLELGARAGVDIGEVYSVDASRRSTSLNAYVNGLGPTKRVVLYDNLLEGVDRTQIEAVVAHELAHLAHSDVTRGIAFVFVVAPFGMFFVSQLAGSMAGRWRFELGTPRGVPALLFSVWLAALLLGLAGNQLSRRMEAAADQYAVALTEDPRAQIGVQRQLTIRNLSDPDPPAWSSFLFGSHPSAVERIGASLAYEAEAPAGR